MVNFITAMNCESVACDGDNISDIPLWLQASEFYRNSNDLGLNLSLGAFSELTSAALFRDNYNISNINDFAEVMHCVDFWGVDEWPESVFDFIIRNVAEVKLWRNDCPLGIAMHFDISDDILDILKNSDFMELTCAYGRLSWLAYAYRSKCVWGGRCTSSAALGGHLGCLKFAHEHGCPWNGRTCANAARSSLDCLKYAHENGCFWGKFTCVAAVRGDMLSCLKYSHENGCPWDEEVCITAASFGYLDCLKYAISKGCPCNEYVLYSALSNGHLSCLIYVHENGCPYSREVISDEIISSSSSTVVLSQERQKCIDYASYIIMEPLDDSDTHPNLPTLIVSGPEDPSVAAATSLY